MFEVQYRSLIAKILSTGSLKLGRNGSTYSIFGEHVYADLSDGKLPLLTGRQMFPRGVLGELAAMLRGPQHINDFTKFGCNYWKQWAESDGSIMLDYGNAWLDWNGINQLEQVRYLIKNDPDSRRIIISGWRPDRMPYLSLPCCHYMYQWYVRNNAHLDMIMHMRSVDVMVGLPSDMLFASAFNIALANDVKLHPGFVHIYMGDTHIYEAHLPQVNTYIANPIYKEPTYELLTTPGTHVCKFEPSDLLISAYRHGSSIRFEVLP